MHYRLRTLLIVALPLAAGCSHAPSEEVPPVVATAVSVNPAVELQWADLAFTIKDRADFHLDQLPDRIRQLDGKRVRLRGYFHLGTPSRESQEFLLLGEINTRPTVVKPGTPPDEFPIHQLAAVEMSAGKTARFTPEPVAVTGRLALAVVEWDGKAFLVFRVVADSVEPVQKRPGYGPALSGGC